MSLVVSIRRADLGLLELPGRDPASNGSSGFNPPGGFGAFGTQTLSDGAEGQTEFQSAGRIWGFWNATTWGRLSSTSTVSIRRADLGLLELIAVPILLIVFFVCFNPPGGFGAFGTPDARAPVSQSKKMFQSAGRIWGFWNPRIGAGFETWLEVSIRRADLGLLELSAPAI